MVQGGGTFYTYAYNNLTRAALFYDNIKASETTVPGTVIIDLPDYTNTTAVKQFRSAATFLRTSDSAMENILTVGNLSTTKTAITEVDVRSPDANYSGGTYILYGVN